MPQKDNNQSKKAWWSQPVQMFLRISGWIAVPLIITLYLGKWLDDKFGTAPWLGSSHSFKECVTAHWSRDSARKIIGHQTVNRSSKFQLAGVVGEH